MDWRPIETIPNTGEVVLVWDGMKKRAFTMRADDWHSGPPLPYWLDDATYWAPISKPPES